MKQVIIFLSIVFSSTIVLAQSTPCVVLLDSIKGIYEGGCNNGKANGEGKSIGIDTYEGTFKNGLPDGMGKYTWKNGDYFYGSWKKGLKDGKGLMHLPVNGTDSVISGYWKRGVYKGQYENPYIIHNVSSDVGRVEVDRVIGGKQSSITLTVESLIGGGSIYPGSSQAPLTTMTGLDVTRGSYQSKSSNTLTNKDITMFQGVIFPFKARFTFGNSMIEIEIFQEGDWNIRIPINNK
jgi:hypothetical protein